MTEERIALSASQVLTVRHHSPDVLEVDSVWQQGPPPPKHSHPQQSEEFTVREGELTVELGTDPTRVFQAGETVTVPPGTPHRMWSAGPNGARATWTITPALRTLDLFRYIAGGTKLPRALRMLWRFRHEYRLSR
ncbi:cupin domain-containing protein [Ornithinimicrobium faecis]|uniref:Cupin domain-containing protein n=1 Tax=Ornithinimicrobium faecis TaxID=2934158 RepID=A0ABY4YV42_9MICO|nr:MULTISPECIES: cupin domain-containing protein [unclassified Ornithinimicrobium]USQ80649.1 cupin domain-containing protein [Ornithinimicrobium sp. HY1793]